MFEKGDLVRTERGFFGRVNWSRKEIDEEWVGVSYIEKEFPPLACMTFRKSEITLVKSHTEDFFNEIFREISNEERRKDVERERRIRATQPDREEKMVRRNFNFNELLKDLSAEDMEEFKEIIRKRGGKI